MQGGSGIGLSIVKNILDMHRGRYGVMSRIGEGSTFWFEFSLQKEA
jgi:signal transduction histidine kinase